MLCTVGCSELFGAPPTVDWTKFSFPDAVRRYEAHFIKLAVKEAAGRITRAARLLGLERHQTLTSLLKNRHKDIPVTRRKRSIISSGSIIARRSEQQRARAVRILNVEDDQMVGEMAKEMLELQGWRVDTSADGTAALEKISGNGNYDFVTDRL